MATRLSKLDLVAVVAVLCYGASVLSLFPRVVSSPAGAVLCFVLTGVAVASAIVPGRVSATARFAAIVACSLGVGMVGGLLLNYLPSGLDALNWNTYGLATTLTAYAVARVRSAETPLQFSWPKLRVPSRADSAMILASALLIGAVVVVSLSSAHPREKPFTEVWLVPDGPANSPAGATAAVLGMKSHESANEDFTVVVNTGKQVTTDRVRLAPDQVWTRDVSVQGMKAEAFVYRSNATDVPYRTVWIVTQ